MLFLLFRWLFNQRASKRIRYPSFQLKVTPKRLEVHLWNGWGAIVCVCSSLTEVPPVIWQVEPRCEVVGTSENYCDFLLAQLTSGFRPRIPGLLTVWVKQCSCGWPYCISLRKLCFTTNFYTSCRWDSLGGCCTLFTLSALLLVGEKKKLLPVLCCLVVFVWQFSPRTSPHWPPPLSTELTSREHHLSVTPNHSGISGIRMPFLILCINPLWMLLWNIAR